MLLGWNSNLLALKKFIYIFLAKKLVNNSQKKVKLATNNQQIEDLTITTQQKKNKKSNNNNLPLELHIIENGWQKTYDEILNEGKL